MAPRVKRFDDAAMHQLVATIRAQGSLILELDTPAEATYQRHQFYAWRKQAAEAAGLDANADIVVRLHGTKLEFVTGFAGEGLRKALRKVGVDVV